MTAIKAELYRYFEKINRRVPARSPGVHSLVAQTVFVRSSVGCRRSAHSGRFFSFLPVLGIWMLPLGLLLITQDVPLLQKPLVTVLAWIEEKWERLRLRWQNR